MSARLSSRERLLATIHHQEPDHVPFWSLWHPDNELFQFRSLFERAEKLLELGLDDTLLLTVPHGISPEVTARVWQENPPGSPYPVLYKEYSTPKGALRQVVKQTEDWKAGQDIPLVTGNADLNVPRSIEFILKGPEDLEKLRYLFQPPNEAQMADFRARARQVHEFADRHGVLVEGGWVSWGDSLLWLLGVEGTIFTQVDDPGFLQELLEMLWQHEQTNLEILLETGVDMITHRGWYETPDFWSPARYRQFIKPLLRKEIEVVHGAGVLYCYINSKGFATRYEDYLDLRIDVLWGVDPVQGFADLPEVKARIGDRVCIWGGLNSFVTLGTGTEGEIRAAMRDAVRILAPGGGFVAFPVDQVTGDIPRRSLEIVLDEWRRVRDYPISAR